MAETISGSITTGIVIAGTMTVTSGETGVIVVGNQIEGQIVGGPTGPQGPQGDPGEGVPTGGSTGQVLKKVSGTDYDTDWGNETVSSVNGQTGVVSLDADDIDDTSTTHKFTTAGDISKLAGIEAGAEVNNISDANATDLTDGGASTLHYHASDRDRANHTGTQTASTISDFDTEVSNNTDVAANTTARHTHANKTTLDAITAAFTTTDETKLDGIEAGADVTDATNVAAAGAVMETDTSTASMSFVIDEDTMVSNSDTKVPSQQSVKAYVDNNFVDLVSDQDIGGSKNFNGGIIAATNTIDDSAIAFTAYYGGLVGLYTGGIGSSPNLFLMGYDSSINFGPGGDDGVDTKIYRTDVNELSFDGAKLVDTRRLPRVYSSSSTSSLTPDISEKDQYCLTALATGLTINAPIGSPQDGEKLLFRIKDDSTARAITWNGVYNGVGVTLPATTTATKTTYIEAVYNSASSKWDVLLVNTEA